MGYIDTSVLVAYYCPEPLSGKAQQAIADLSVPTISPLVEVGFCSALATKVRASSLPADAAGRILATFESHLAQGAYRVVPIGPGEYALARQWLASFATSLRAPDALHVAAASASGLVLLTADRLMSQAAQHLAVKCKLLD